MTTVFSPICKDSLSSALRGLSPIIFSMDNMLSCPVTGMFLEVLQGIAYGYGVFLYFGSNVINRFFTVTVLGSLDLC